MNNEFSVPQLEILTLLSLLNGYIATSEGAGYRVWMEDVSFNKVNHTLRRDTVSLLYKKGMIAIYERRDSPYFYYKPTEKLKRLAEKVLNSAGRRSTLVRLRLREKGWM